MMRLVVTRADDRLADLRAAADARGVTVVPLPLTEVRPVPFAWPPESGNPQWLFFTSGNGVRFFFEQLENLKISFDDQIKFALPGEKSAAHLKQFGHAVSFLPAEPYGRLLFEQFSKEHGKTGLKVVYARAEAVNFDPQSLFDATDLEYSAVVCYKNVVLPTSDYTRREVAAADRILFTAPSAVHAFQAQIGSPSVAAFALGKTTAAAMQQCGWSDYAVLEKAAIQQVLERL